MARERRETLTRRRPLLKEVERLDRELAQLHEESERIEKQLADPAFYARPDAGDVRHLALRRQELARRTEEAEHRWLVLHAELDQLGEA
jgi:ATP-binding cassette subfamily F protein 3